MTLQKSADKTKHDIELFESIYNKKITKLTLRNAIDLPEYVEFSDNDLIEEALSFLKSINLKHISRNSYKQLNGGGQALTLYFDNFEKLSLVIIENDIIINNTTYTAEKSPIINYIKSIKSTLKKNF